MLDDLAQELPGIGVVVRLEGLQGLVVDRNPLRTGASGTRPDEFDILTTVIMYVRFDSLSRG